MPKIIEKSTRDRIDRLLNEKKSTCEIAEEVSVSQSAVARICYATLKNFRMFKSGPSRIFNNQDEKYVCSLVTTGKCSTATTIQREL